MYQVLKTVHYPFKDAWSSAVNSIGSFGTAQLTWASLVVIWECKIPEVTDLRTISCMCKACIDIYLLSEWMIDNCRFRWSPPNPLHIVSAAWEGFFPFKYLFLSTNWLEKWKEEVLSFTDFLIESLKLLKDFTYLGSVIWTAFSQLKQRL